MLRYAVGLRLLAVLTHPSPLDFGGARGWLGDERLPSGVRGSACENGSYEENGLVNTSNLSS